ncbi:MAG TPA: histidinol dehydrogenase [Acidimicrobiales bacterium]|nr:histidinol dehydrogenase [Acidimicrobiales bacterium]
MAQLLTRLDLRGATGELRDLLPSPKLAGEGPVEAVRSVLAAVRAGGDASVAELTARFDKVRPASLHVPQADIDAACRQVPAELLAALEEAARAIRSFHRSELAAHRGFEHTSEHGIRTREMLVPVARAGCYVPGGRAPLASTVLMTAIPARVAGVEQVVVCSPPSPAGTVPATVLAAAAVAGVDEVYAVGGAQAIGAMAYGTETVRPVDVIVGPGNSYVATAQRLVAQDGAVGVPSAFAGPSEVVVVADGSSPAEYAALDLVVQAEHGPEGLAWLVCWSEEVATAVEAAVERFVAASPRRAEVTATLEHGGWSVIVDGPREAMDVCNVVAPEHLELITAEPEGLVPLVRSAGAVFCGPWAPASVGDYIAGPSHVLPTARSARFSSALGTQDFLKRVHLVALGPREVRLVAPSVAALAEAEGLSAHAESVLLRARFVANAGPGAAAVTPAAASVPARAGRER